MLGFGLQTLDMVIYLLHNNYLSLPRDYQSLMVRNLGHGIKIPLLTGNILIDYDKGYPELSALDLKEIISDSENSGQQDQNSKDKHSLHLLMKKLIVSAFVKKNILVISINKHENQPRAEEVKRENEEAKKYLLEEVHIQNIMPNLDKVFQQISVKWDKLKSELDNLLKFSDDIDTLMNLRDALTDLILRLDVHNKHLCFIRKTEGARINH